MTPTDWMTSDPAALRRQFAQLAPSSVYMTVDDNLRVTAYNALTAVVVNVRARVLNLEGRVVPNGADVFTPTTSRAASTTIVVTDEGWLLGGEVFVSGASPLEGQTFVVVELVRGQLAAAVTPVQVIASGYVTAKMPLTFPGALKSSVDGQGAIRAITGTTPGAGVDISETVPTGARWELLLFLGSLVTAAAVANRIPALIIDDGVNAEYVWAMGGNETASISWTNTWAQGVPSLFTAALNLANAPLPSNNRLPAGARIRTSTTGIQGADQWASPKYLVREWIEGA
jgi:hypothetical protein